MAHCIHHRLLRPVALALALLVTGCGATSTTDADPARSTRPDSTGPVSKVLVVIEENHSLAQMESGMPYLAGLSHRYGLATDWHAITHPSEPNYLAMVAGSTFGITDDRAPVAHLADTAGAHTVLDDALANGRTARVYAESMPEPCHVWDHPDRAVGTPVYAVRHNPWVYFEDSRDNCIANEGDLDSFQADAASGNLPDIGLLVPDLRHDAHDASLAEADNWLKAELAPVLASSDFTDGRLVVVVTADEDDKQSGNRVLTAVLHPSLDSVVVDSPLTHYSLARYLAEVVGADPPREAATAPSLTQAFRLP